MRRVVVTGLGAITPIGNNVKDYWGALLEGKSGAGPITHFDTSAFKTKFACHVKNFDPGVYLEKSEFRKMDLFTQFAMGSMDECVKDSAINLSSCDLERAGVIWATGIGGFMSFESEFTSYVQNGKIPRFSPFLLLKLIPNIAAGQISIKYGLLGVSYGTMSACASSNHALADAFNLIRLGKADLIFAGGSEAPITEASIGSFNAMRALSERNDEPEKASRPFDKDRDGFVMGEGAGVLLLEDLEHALQRGARIYCELAGCGYASDAYHITAPHPEGKGAVYAMKEAIREAGLKPSEISYINTHGTSTPIGDPSECRAISNLFADNLNTLHVSSTKSMTGHLLEAPEPLNPLPV